MENHTRKSAPNTKILRGAPIGSILVAIIPGLPYGAPKFGTIVLTQYGEAICSGIQTSGEDVIEEVCFTLK